jgi:phosphodiesterase/alkaline phosphatase D-like protein
MSAFESRAGSSRDKVVAPGAGGMRPLRGCPVPSGGGLAKFAFGPRLDVFFVSSPRPVADIRMTGQAADLGPDLIERIKRELAASRAVWKVIVSGVPLGLGAWDAFRRPAAARRGDPASRRIADLLRFVETAGISNAVWLALDAECGQGDAALAAALEPLWEMLVRPEQAGAFAPEPERSGAGMRFYAVAEVSETTREVTVLAMGNGGDLIWKAELAAA